MKHPFLLCCAVFLFACDTSGTESLSDGAKKRRIDAMIEEIRRDVPAAPDWTPNDLAGRRRSADWVLVDVRPPRERQISRIPGSLSVQEWEERRDEFPADVTVVAYCTIGRRSAEWVARRRAGGVEAVNLAGSLLAWAHAGYALEDAEGHSTRRLHVYGRRWDLAPEGFTTVW